MSNSPENVDPGKSEIGNAIEFQEHNIGCLRTIVRLIEAPEFLIKCNSPWELCQHLELLVNGSGEEILAANFYKQQLQEPQGLGVLPGPAPA